MNFLQRLALQKKKSWWQLASRCCWNRARLWHASELVSFLVGIRTYQHSGSGLQSLIWSRCDVSNYPVTDSSITGKPHTGESKLEHFILVFKAPSQNYEKRLLASLCMSVCSPLRPSAWNNSTLTGQIVMKFGNWVFFKTLSRNFKFR